MGLSVPAALLDEPQALVEVPGALRGLFRAEGIRRGSTVAVAAERGGVSLALAMAATVTSGGGWAAVVGVPSLGVVAAVEMGARLEHLALVPDPGPRWPTVATALLDGVDLLVLAAGGRPAAVDARRLVARARERGRVLVVLEQSAFRWTERLDARLAVTSARWEGLGDGHGHLQARRVEVVLQGRGALAGERRTALWLPGRSGGPELVQEPEQEPVQVAGLVAAGLVAAG